MNGSAVPVAVKNRPRIPTPDVTKEVLDRESKLAHMNSASGGVSGAGAVSGTHHHYSHEGHATELPLVHVVLSPIQEMESGSGGLHHHHHHHHHQGGPGDTTTLAQSVLSPALTAAGINSVTFGGNQATATTVITTTPMNMAVSTVTHTPVIVNQPLLAPLAFGGVSSASNSPSQSLQVVQPAVTVTELSSGAEDEGTSSANDSAARDERSRKASVVSQANSTKRSEVYV
jgi:hypothetical protein